MVPPTVERPSLFDYPNGGNTPQAYIKPISHVSLDLIKLTYGSAIMVLEVLEMVVVMAVQQSGCIYITEQFKDRHNGKVHGIYLSSKCRSHCFVLV